MYYPNYLNRRPSKMNEYGLKRIPDYTELAYKEAVSKLRYFLSGNYAPSVSFFLSIFILKFNIMGSSPRARELLRF